MVEGFVIESESGRFLTQLYHWYPHDCIADARVHTREQVVDILGVCSSWQFKPVRLYPAKWDGTRTTVTGDPIPIDSFS
jgi:hypothetical protein